MFSLKKLFRFYKTPCGSFKNLFQFHKKPDDELNQAQREAIVDLLNYCSFSDFYRSLTDYKSSLIDGLESDLHRALTEGNWIDALEFKLHWEGNIDFDKYEKKSAELVRNLLNKPASVDGFLKGVRAKLDSDKSRKIALFLVDKFIKDSGEMSNEESHFYLAISKALQ